MSLHARQAGLRVGILLTLLVALAAAVSLVWLPWPPTAMDIPHRLEPPSLAHPCGTDSYGRDVLSILMAGARTALSVALAAALVGIGAGVPLGLAASLGGLGGELVNRAGDVVFAFPTLLVAVLIAASTGPGLSAAVAAIGIFNVPVFARVTRGAAAGLWQRDFVLAARVAGKSSLRIALSHVLPNILGLLMVQAAIQISLAVVAEAGLSYIGLGVQPPRPSWGRMLGEAQTLAGIAPWLVLGPGTAILVTVLGFGLLGDGLRDRLDPRLAGPVEADR